MPDWRLPRDRRRVIAALPTLVKTWQLSCNNAQAALGSALIDNRTVLLAVKNQMLAFGSNPFTVDYSCNSVTAGTLADGVDRWAAIANLVWGAAGGAHSWIVLKQAGISSTWRLLLSLEGSSATGSVLTAAVSPIAGFTGGTTTARPTATDESVMLAGASTFTTIDQSLRWSVGLSTDGQCFYFIMCYAGAATNFAVFTVPVNATTGWTSPAYSVWIPAATGQPLVGNLQTGNNGKGRIGATTCTFNLSCETGIGAVSGPADTTFGNIANEVDGTWPIWPLGLNSGTVGVRGRHGTIQDLWYGSSNVPSGDSYPATGTTGQFAQFGNIIVPWNNGPVNLS